MAFIPVPKGVQLCFDFVTAGQNWQVCIMLRKSAGDPTPTDLDTAANAGENWWGTTFRSLFSAQTVLRQVRATDMTVQGGPVSTLVSNTAGNGSGNGLPIGAAIVASLRTAKRGRSYRGRSYWSGLLLSAQTSPTDITGTVATAIGVAMTALQTTLDGDGFDMVVASRQHNGAVTSPAETNEITAFVVDTHFDSQRRRLAGRGT